MRKKHTFDDVREIFRENGCELLEEFYVNNVTPLKYICECGEEAYVRLGDFKRGRRCKKCGINKGKEKTKLSIDEVRMEFQDGGCVLLSEIYINSYTPMEYVCECGNVSLISISRFKIGQRCKICGISKISGKNNPKYNHKLTEKDRMARRHIEGYSEWRDLVFSRDTYTCRCCRKGGVNLITHHINSFNAFPEQRLEVNNGVTLCKDCHNRFHRIYGYGDNTEDQFKAFIKGTHTSCDD